jgi:hypothetical protein
MKPPSHKGAGPIGRVAGDTAALTDPAQEAWRYSHDVSQRSASGVLALASRTANQAISQQIEMAFDVGRVMREQSQELERTANTSVPAGPWRDSLVQVAGAQARFADMVVAQAIQWGRRFGGLAFAFPLPDRRN